MKTALSYIGLYVVLCAGIGFLFELDYSVYVSVGISIGATYLYKRVFDKNENRRTIL